MVKRSRIIYVYMEGGGDSQNLHTELRQGMRAFLEKAGLKGMLPKVFACGRRDDAYRDFKQAIKANKNDEIPFLLVDSECAVAKEHENKPWDHLKQRDHWDKPDDATDEQCHLMVQCMESWFLADPEALEKFYDQGFNKNHIPAQGQNVEKIEKEQVYKTLEMATRNCKTKGEYGKGKHSFKLLGLIDPEKVKTASDWAKRFFDKLKTTLS